MEYKYKTHSTCSREILINIDEKNKTVENVSFAGGCNGNLQGIAALVKGKKIDDVINCLKGINCNFKGTSCPDQLARALEEIEKNI